MYQHLLLATDGSEFADHAVLHGLNLAKAIHAKITVVTVTDMYPTGMYSPIPWPSEIARYEAAAAQGATKILDRAKEVARKLDVVCEAVHISDERAADGILKACRERGCDLIVMASHGRSGIERLLIGSQTLNVLTHSTVPVLVLRP